MNQRERSIPAVCGLAVGLALAYAQVAGAVEAVVVGSELRLDRAQTREVQVAAGAGGRAAVVWTRFADGALRGNLWAQGASNESEAIDFGGQLTPRLLRTEFRAEDLATAYAGAAKAALVSTIDDEAAIVGTTVLTTEEVEDWSQFEVDFLADGDGANDGRFVTAHAASDGSEVEVELRVLDRDGETTAVGSVTAVGRLDALRLSAHGSEFLVGMSLSEACGGGRRQTRSVVTRWDEDANLVRNPRRFAAARCGDPAKRLQFLDGPTSVGSLAVLRDGSARRFIAGDPPPSEIEFVFRIAASEEMLAFGSDAESGRFVVVTRTAAADRPVRLFAQLFGRDGRARSGKVELSGQGLVGSKPVAAVALEENGTAWIAYSRAAALNRAQGLFLRRVGFYVP